MQCTYQPNSIMQINLIIQINIIENGWRDP